MLLNMYRNAGHLFLNHVQYFTGKKTISITPKVYIAVVVQEMVDAEKAGVMFTVHPSTGEEKILIEAAWGLGEGVVSGTVTPDTCWYDKETNEILDYKVSDKKIMFKRIRYRHTIKVDVPEDLT